MSHSYSVQSALSDISWIRDAFPHLLRTGPVPPRFKYFHNILSATPAGTQASVLDAGCGNGFMTEHFAAAGYAVTGADSSPEAIERAREHADRVGLSITYSIASPDTLPFSNASFDAVTCCDLLEHTSDISATVAEISRVLKPGGILLYSTINKTLKSKIAVNIAQQWSWTRITEMPLYDWELFVSPDKLRHSIGQAGMELRESVGLQPRISSLSVLRQMHKLSKGKITYAEFGRRCKISNTTDISVSYMGYAIRL